MTGTVRTLTQGEILRNKKNRMIDVLKKHTHNETFQDLLDFMGMRFIGSPIVNPELLKEFLGEDFSLTDKQIDLMYYEYIIVHKETNLALLCFLGSQGFGSFGFELTKGNFLNHLAYLKENPNN